MKLWQSMRQLLSVLLGLAILGLLIWSVYRLFHVVISSVSKLDTQVAVAVLTPSIAALASVATITLGRHLERKMAVESHLRSQRIPVYEGFVEFWFQLLRDSRRSSKEAANHDERMEEFLRSFTQKALLWASDDVLVRYAAFRRSAISSATTGKYDPSALFVFEDLLFAFRRDLGYKNNGLKRGDLLAQFIIDIDKYVPRPERNR